ncbi:hypothetical protein N9E09_01105 [bacterium]|nr:hypothetical protein [bacterium]
MKINELDKNIGVTQQQLDSLENVLDRVFASVGIDVEFTKHFIDRVNDERNIRPITIKELAMLFKKEFVKYGKPIAQLGPDAQAVMKDLETDINIPFVLNWNGEELELVAKTVMRKKDFKSSNKEFAVESDDIMVKGKKSDFPDNYDATNDTTFNDFSKKEFKQVAMKAISSLNKQEQMVIKARFGLEPFNTSYTLQQIADAMNLSRTRIRQIQDRALRILKHPSRSRGMRSYLNQSKEFTVESDNQSGVYSDEKNNVEIHWKRIDHPSVAKDHLDIEAYQNGKRVDINNQQADHYRYLINQEMNETETLGSKINFPGMSGTTVNTSTTTKTRVPTPKPARNRFDKIVNWSKSLFNSEGINEDIGSLPPLVDLIVLAVLAQTTVAGIKTMFKVAVKTGKGLNKLRKLTKQAGIALDAKLSESEMVEDFLADKSEQEKKFWNAALEALHRLQGSKESKQSIESYAFDIARSFNGMSSKELLALYKLKYGIDETLEEAKQSNPLVVLDKLADRSDNNAFPVKFYDDTVIKVTPKKAKKFMDVYYQMADEQRDVINKYIKTKKGFMQAINDFNIPI